MVSRMRLHRALARAGVASRRSAELLIAAGRVRINGAVAQVGQGIDPASDRVTVDGQNVSLELRASTWIVLHKPAGVMTTRSDPKGRRTVFDLVEDIPGLTYVGRLDYDTEGVLLLTTDGDAVHRLTHPSGEIERVYVATVHGDAPLAVERARRGVVLGDGPVHAVRASARRLTHSDNRWEFEVVIREGRKREVRRLCSALGLKVERLVRTAFGPVRLGRLAVGEWRELTDRERAELGVLIGQTLDGGRSL